MKSLFASVILLISVTTYSQNLNDAVIVVNGGTVQTMNIKSKPKETKGSFYYNNDWYTGTIKLFSGEEIQAYPLKYDMKMNQIDIKVNESVKVISIGAIKEITWLKPDGKPEVLRNISLFNKIEGYGFLSILAEGNMSLFKKTDLDYMEANYNGVVDAGSESNRYVKTEKYYIKSDDKFIAVKKRKKSILNKFKEKADIVELFASENDLNFKDDADLERIFSYYNNL